MCNNNSIYSRDDIVCFVGVFFRSEQATTDEEMIHFVLLVRVVLVIQNYYLQILNE